MGLHPSAASAPAPEGDALQRFRASLSMDFEKWKEGIGHDQEAGGAVVDGRENGGGTFGLVWDGEGFKSVGVADSVLAQEVWLAD